MGRCKVSERLHKSKVYLRSLLHLKLVSFGSALKIYGWKFENSTFLQYVMGLNTAEKLTSHLTSLRYCEKKIYVSLVSSAGRCCRVLQFQGWTTFSQLGLLEDFWQIEQNFGLMQNFFKQ